MAQGGRVRVSFLGPEATFTHEAALRHFGEGAELLPVASIEAVFDEAEAGRSDFGVVPVENSTEGVISHTLDMFACSPLSICGEVVLRINHNLLGSGGDLSSIERVMSHQQSFAQCRKWLDAHLPAAERIPVSSNAEAARRAADDARAAAVASAIAAQTYGLEIIAANIEDEPNNTTRFLVIGSRKVSATGSDKTSLLIAAKNQPGALFRLLAPFAQREISMTRIESRPARSGMWEYVFFIDIQGHAEDANVHEALAELQENASLLKVLGSYPTADV